MFDFIFLIGEGIAHVPQSRDTLTRAYARILDCWRAPEAGPDAGRGRRVVVGPMVSIGR